MAKKFPLFNEEICINDSILKYDYLRSNYCEILMDWEEHFKKYYKSEVVNLKKLEEAFIDFSNEFTKLVDFSIFVLMENNIDFVDQSKLINMIESNFPDFEPFHAVEMTMNKIKKASEELASQIQITRSYERSARSHWEGGGFGLGGALKGAFTAGALNMATSVMRGIGDSITDSRDKAKFNRFIKSVLQDSEYGVLNAFIVQMRLNCFYCLVTIYIFLTEKGKIPKCVFNIDDLMPKINNYMSFSEFGAAYDLLIKSIQINPYSLEVYNHFESLVDKISTSETQENLFKEEIAGLYEYFRPDIFEF